MSHHLRFYCPGRQQAWKSVGRQVEALGARVQHNHLEVRVGKCIVPAQSPLRTLKRAGSDERSRYPDEFGNEISLPARLIATPSVHRCEERSAIRLIKLLWSIPPGLEERVREQPVPHDAPSQVVP